MRLVTALAAGIRGAEQGTFEVYRRGTSTTISTYGDFEGDSLTTSRNLDANGGVVVYVAELADVVVYDTDGVTVREFTEGDREDCIEVASASFTGTRYDTAASAAGNPVTLATVMDRWYTNNGAIDWKVLVSGSATTIQAAFAGIAGLFINVKDPTYGAVGNGSTDDSTAIQAAETAAKSGKIVIFPPGTYFLNGTAITRAADSQSCWIGSGAKSIIRQDGTANALTVAGTSANQEGTCWIQGIKFDLSASPGALGTTRLVELSGTGVDLVFRDCYFGSRSYFQHYLVYLSGTAGTARVTFDHCTFDVKDENQHAIAAVAAYDGFVKVMGCRFYVAATTYSVGLLVLDDAEIIGNTFDIAALSSGAGALLTNTGSQAATQRLLVVGNKANQPAAGVGAMTAINLATPGRLVEYGNDFPRLHVDTVTTDVTNQGYSVYTTARVGQEWKATSNAATLTLNLNNQESYVLTRTSGAALDLTLTAPQCAGLTAYIVIRNEMAATSLTITGVGGVSGQSVDGSAWATVPAVTAYIWTLRSFVLDAGGYHWFLAACAKTAVANT